MEAFDVLFLVLFFAALSLATGFITAFTKGATRLIIIIPFAVTGLAGVVMSFIGEWSYSPIGDIDFPAFKFVFKYALYAGAAVGVAVYAVLKKELESKKLVGVVACTALAYIFSFLAAGMGWFVFTNGYSDSGDKARHITVVIGKKEKRIDKSREYYITYMNQDGSGKKTVKVPRMLYAKTLEGDLLAIETKPGRHGIEWVVSKYLEYSPDAVKYGLFCATAGQSREDYEKKSKIYAHFQKEQVLETEIPVPVSLGGTGWRHNKGFGLEFAHNGTLKKNGQGWGTWSQDGVYVSMDVNKGYVIYKGLVYENEIHGLACNKKGLRWRWSLLRQ